VALPNLYLVVMAGGSGTRFWPKSTASRPKQLLSFAPEGVAAETLLGQTLSRFDGIVPPRQRMIVTTSLLETAVQEQCAGARILAEPQGRNTAPCVYWAARAVAEHDPKAVMMVMPADHYMTRPDRFRETLGKACEWAATHDDLVTLGIRPDRPETGYGYLKIGVSMGAGCSKVDGFVEKPNLERARAFLSAGCYLWNGGMFLWRAEVILRAFDEFMPEMRAAWDAEHGDVARAYPKMSATSIDYGVMERAKNVVSFPLECGWDDLGSWTSLEALADVLGARHPAGVVTGGEALAIDSTGNIIDTPNRLTALLGVNDLIVVEHGNVILVADKARAQDIKLVVERLKKLKPELL
jgi:mannose-1-phosphate guanylyltransferase